MIYNYIHLLIHLHKTTIKTNIFNRHKKFKINIFKNQKIYNLNININHYLIMKMIMII